MNYQQSLKPWVVVGKDGEAIARFKSESDADGHAKVLQRKQGRPFKVRFWPVLIGTAIALHIMMVSESADARRRTWKSRYYRPVSVIRTTGQSYGRVVPPDDSEWRDRTGRRLNREQLELLGTLDYSANGKGQSYKAMSFLGLPQRRSNSADYHQMPNGRWLAVSYDSNGYARGYTIGDDTP
jgi:hypothetical protein